MTEDGLKGMIMYLASKLQSVVSSGHLGHEPGHDELVELVGSLKTERITERLRAIESSKEIFALLDAAVADSTPELVGYTRAVVDAMATKLGYSEEPKVKPNADAKIRSILDRAHEERKEALTEGTGNGGCIVATIEGRVLSVLHSSSHGTKPGELLTIDEIPKLVASGNTVVLSP